MKLLNRQLLVNKSSYPERVLQFGTGVLLRGLPDYFIEKANSVGKFNGGIVVVKSTDKGGTAEFDRQDNLYTVHIKGIEKGRDVQEVLLVSAINRVVSATHDWNAILDSAENPDMEIVISNTTEVGIVFDDKDWPLASPPVSFPGKLTAILYRRFKVFNGAADKGLVILPTELIDRNGEVLQEIVVALAERHQLGPDFIDWLQTCNDFCNTLVDRIVPGKLSDDNRRAAEEELGYADNLAIVAEPFCLWAIESSNPRVTAALSFVQADNRVVIAPDIGKFKELKLRLLNGCHTFSCGLARCCGFDTVKEAVDNPIFLRYVRRLMHQEIVPTLVAEGISEAEVTDFADNVIDRFRNPYLQHQWLSIAVNYTSKMRTRNMATLERHFREATRPAHCMALGFAGYLLSMGEVQSRQLLAEWEYDLKPLGNFAETVKRYLELLQQRTALEVIDFLNENETLGR